MSVSFLHEFHFYVKLKFSRMLASKGPSLTPELPQDLRAACWRKDGGSSSCPDDVRSRPRVRGSPRIQTKEPQT